MISLTEGLYASLLTIIETMSARASGSRLTSESCPRCREKTCSTFVSVVRWHAVCLKTTKSKGNRIRSCHIISNSFSTTFSVLTKRWYSPSETLDYLQSIKPVLGTFQKVKSVRPSSSRSLLKFQNFPDTRICRRVLRTSAKEETPWK